MSSITIKHKVIQEIEFWFLKFPNIKKCLKAFEKSTNQKLSINQDEFLAINDGDRKIILIPFIRFLLNDLAVDKNNIELFYQEKGIKIRQKFTGSLNNFAQIRCEARNSDRLKENIKKCRIFLGLT